MSRLRILFIGNSFTARNDLPGLIASIAATSGHTIDHQLVSAGGASLRRHLNAGEARTLIERGKFDIVVLQEQSTLPIKNRSRMHENVRLFDQLIRDNRARTALYMTWAREHAPKTQSAITEAYSSIAKEIGAILIPAGVAWRDALRDPDLPALFDADGSHPSIAGSYLVACLFARALLGKKALTKVPVLGDLDARHCKRLALIANEALRVC